MNLYRINTIVLNSLITGITALSLSHNYNAQATTIEFFNHSDFTNASGNLTIINFDDFPEGNGALQGNEYITQGLTISQRDGLPINLVTDSGINNVLPNNINSAPNIISSSFIVSEFINANSDNFDFILSQPVSSAGLWIGGIGSGGDDTTEVQFLDSLDQIIASEILDLNSPGLIPGTQGPANGLYDNRIFYGITTTYGNISKIRTVEPAGDADGVVYDDVQFSTINQSVPEPSAILSLLTIGGIALGASKKKDG